MCPDIDEWIARQLAAAPPLSQAQRDRLAALLTVSRDNRATGGEAA